MGVVAPGEKKNLLNNVTHEVKETHVFDRIYIFVPGRSHEC